MDEKHLSLEYEIKMTSKYVISLIYAFCSKKRPLKQLIVFDFVKIIGL
mgnify:CR=1 FL=1